MDPLLLTITLASLLAAAGASFYAWRLSHEARERSAARVAALAADIDGNESPAPPVSDAEPGGEAVTTPGTLFAGTRAEPGGLSRFAPAILAGVLIVGGLGAAAILLSSGTGAAASAAGEHQKPIELLSLRHDVREGMLHVTGLVRNPAGNLALERLNAVVFLFDDRGGFLSSGRAPLDFTTLGAGEESPFVVSLGAPAGVARYRVSFRRDEGGMLPHVDRRGANVP